jgi:serine/threonine protein phosphatase PrpC
VTAVDPRCPSCASPVGAVDVFCESCGHELTPLSSIDPGGRGDDPTEELARIDMPAPTADHPRTHLVQPGGAIPRDPCLVCGEPVADDGFCTSCGAKARSPRDHWTESPSDWVGGVCDKGIVHARNEDAMALASTLEREFAVLVVCDGVTTAPDSDRASLAASQAACELLTAAPRSAGSFTARLSSWQPMLTAACTAANAEAVAIAHALGDPDEPPSCTFVAAVCDADLVAVAWCGDSRAYWLADDGEGSEQLTIDHSLGTEMIRAGRSRAEAEADPTCHTITRWLGADSIDPTSEFRTVRIERPGWLVVVSDGMWNEASAPAELAALMAEAAAAGATTPTALAESLAAFANERGGHDNITVALARCEPPLP